MTATPPRAAVAGFVAVSVVAGIIAIGLWLWMARANGQGLRWARGVATGLGAVNVMFTVFGLATGPGTGLPTLFALVGITLAVVILVLLYRPESSAYYASRDRPRRARPGGASTAAPRRRRPRAWPPARR